MAIDWSRFAWIVRGFRNGLISREDFKRKWAAAQRKSGAITNEPRF